MSTRQRQESYGAVIRCWIAGERAYSRKRGYMNHYELESTQIAGGDWVLRSGGIDIGIRHVYRVYEAYEGTDLDDADGERTQFWVVRDSKHVGEIVSELKKRKFKKIATASPIGDIWERDDGQLYDQ